MGLFLLSVAFLVVVAVVYWYRQNPVVYVPSDTRIKSSPFHAVEINPPKDACQAVRQVQSIRFLAKEAPLLPLPDCTAKNCGCRFVHYADRREEDRRMRILVGQYDGERRQPRSDRRRAM